MSTAPTAGAAPARCRPLYEGHRHARTCPSPRGFFAVPYSESLSLAMVVWALLAARRGRWWLAGAAAALAVLSKYYLAILVVALIVEYLHQQDWSPRRIHRDIVGVAIPPALALGAWTVYMGRRFGQPLVPPRRGHLEAPSRATLDDGCRWPSRTSPSGTT